jgi:hypothetical protein
MSVQFKPMSCCHTKVVAPDAGLVTLADSVRLSPASIVAFAGSVTAGMAGI